MFLNRRQAGQRLAEKLSRQGVSGKSPLVISLPKGGVVVGGRIAKSLKAPHRVVVAKKIRAPGQPELAIGALSLSEGSLFLNQSLIERLGISSTKLKQAVKAAQKVIAKEKGVFGKMVAADFKGRTVIIADDGAATGATLISAIRHILSQKPKQIIVALPVSPSETTKKIKNLVNKTVVLEQPDYFMSVSQFYHFFPQISLGEAKNILEAKS